MRHWWICHEPMVFQIHSKKNLFQISHFLIVGKEFLTGIFAANQHWCRTYSTSADPETPSQRAFKLENSNVLLRKRWVTKRNGFQPKLDQAFRIVSLHINGIKFRGSSRKLPTRHWKFFMSLHGWRYFV